MLSKNAKNVYRYLCVAHGAIATIDQICGKLNLRTNEARSACQCLVDNGLAVFIGESRIQCTERGRNRLTFAVAETMNHVIWSVIIPILVSIATTLVTMWLSDFWA